MMLRCGIDLGGTKTEGVILDAGGREVFRERVATDSSSYETVLGGIERLYRRMVSDVRGAPHTLGLGTPGAVSRRTGMLKNSNTTCLNGTPIARDLPAPRRSTARDGGIASSSAPSSVPVAGAGS